jgi:hypothetical protein
MGNETLASVVTDIPTVVTPLMGIVGQAIDLVTEHPLLFAFVACGFAAIGIRYAYRILHKAKNMA